MKKVIVILVLQLCCIGILWGCGCDSPVHDLKTDIDSSDAIFIGVITDINKDHTFHLNNGIGKGLKYINFDVLKIHKGVNPAQLKVTLFDSWSNTSCEGILSGKAVGDTVLVFAKAFRRGMLGSYLCGRHPTFQRLSARESMFIDTAHWDDPRTKYDNPELFIKKQFPAVNRKIVSKQQSPLNAWLMFSLAINVIMGVLLFYKSRR
jgi:hypothetical protein